MIHHSNASSATSRPASDNRRPVGFRAAAMATFAFAIAVGFPGQAQGLETAARRVEPTCLAISPLRAIPALTGRKDTLGPEGWRDAVVRALRQARPDSSWMFRPAGECPATVATIEVFQFPTDVVASAQGQALRLRMEWRHVAGPAEFFLPVTEKRPLEPMFLANELLAFAVQQMAQLELSSHPSGALARLLSGEEWRNLGPTPRSIRVPPGALSVSFDSKGRQRRVDTLVEAGKNYLVVADFRTARIDPGIRWESRPTWPLWSMALISVAGGLWATREQVLAQRAYDRLGADATTADFSESWSRLRTANLWRNGLFSAAIVFGMGAGWMEWSTRSNP